MEPMSVIPAGGESNTTLCVTPELFSKDTAVPLETVRVVGSKELERMQNVLSEHVDGGGGGGGGGEIIPPPPPPPPPQALNTENIAITTIEPIFFIGKARLSLFGY